MIRISLSSLLCLALIFSASIGSAKEPTISPSLYKSLQKTEKLIAEKAYTKAEQKLKEMLSKVKKGSYGECAVLRSLSSVYAIKNNYKKSADFLNQCLQLNVLPENQQQQGIANLGQLYMAMEQYQKAISILTPWLKNNQKPVPEIYALMANAHAQLKHYKQALPFISQAIANSKKPNESWFQLQLALYYQLENYAKAAVLLQKLIQLFPEKKAYWSQLAAVYQQQKQFTKAATIKHLAYNKGFISKEKELLELANLFIYIGNPHKAARLLRSEISSKRITSNAKNWELLANSWTQAQEYDEAINALETASKLDSKGRLYQQLGQIYVEQEQWEKAITSLKQALAKGGLKRVGSTYILLGMSYFETKQTKEAQQAFNKAKQFKKTQKAAQQWLKYIADEQNYQPG